MTTFAASYREHVMPTLRQTARVQGLFLALDRRTFSEAYYAVFDLARRRGAMFLPDEVLHDLEEWILKEIVGHCIEFEPAVEERRAIADRVAADVAPWGT